MKKRYSYRAYLNGAQRKAAARLFGCTRVVWNTALNNCITQYQETGKKPTRAELSQALTQDKKTDEHHYLKEVSSVPLQQALEDLDKAYTNFFNSVTGKRKGKRVGVPKYKKRSNRQSARFTKNAGYKIEQDQEHGHGWVTLPKIGRVYFPLSRKLPSDPSSVTLIKEPDGTYYLSFVVEVEQQIVPNTSGRVAGIDLGLTDLAAIVYSDGTREKVANPRYGRTRARKLARLQRELSRKEKGSKNYDKARIKVAKQHHKIRNQRLDHYNKLALRLVTENQGIALENLAVSGLCRTKVAKSMYDAAVGMLVRLIKEKALLHGCEVVQVSRWEPSSQTCAVCGRCDGRKPLSVRVWTCPQCGAVVDRDWNAALNVLVAAGLAETLNACGGSVRLRLAGADPVKQELIEQTSPILVGAA